MASANRSGVSRALLETYLRGKLKELKDDPERGSRNLVDMAAHLSNSRFQKHFFNSAQDLLKQPDSGYYRLIQDTAAHVDTERLLQFGMNLGYESLTEGAKTIRSVEAEQRCNVPWTVGLFTGSNFPEMEDSYRSLLRQGKALGIHTWVFFHRECPELLLPLLAEETDCAFVLFTVPRSITSDFLDEAAGLNHLMLSVAYEDGAEWACAQLRARQMLYGVHTIYDEKTAAEDWEAVLTDVGELHPPVTLFVPMVRQEAQDESPMYAFVRAVRSRQDYPSAPIDLWWDTRMVDRIISEDDCLVAFDADGNLFPYCCAAGTEAKNFRTAPLLEILKSCCPKG